MLWKCYYTSASSLLGKMDEFKEKVQKNDYYMMGIAESWAKNEILNSELHIEGYTMYRQDRPSTAATKGGGVVLYVKQCLNSQLIPNLNENRFQDSVWVKIKCEEPT